MHNIQDYIFGAGNIIFILALLPSIFSSSKPAFNTSLPTASILTVFAGTYLTMHYWFSTVVLVVSAICWSILAFQKWRIN